MLQVSLPVWYAVTTRPLWHCARIPSWLTVSLSEEGGINKFSLERHFRTVIQEIEGTDSKFLRTLDLEICVELSTTSPHARKSQEKEAGMRLADVMVGGTRSKESPAHAGAKDVNMDGDEDEGGDGERLGGRCAFGACHVDALGCRSRVLVPSPRLVASAASASAPSPKRLRAHVRV
ncbi:hypothetical protein JB92DRAFT_3245347 [Gautieria morchelliformis]|nr:hypothetical protein JB92DRAFT_3245347 [Gautieria morchelliformis]